MLPFRSLLVLAAAAALAACSSTPLSAPTSPAKPMAAAPAPVAEVAKPMQAAAQPQTTAASTVATVALPEYLDPRSALSNGRSVFFDYDDFSIKQEFAAVVERHGKYLASHPAVAIKIEGNTDERGGAEYNLALGQKRADALVRALRIYGVKDSQLEAVSWGEEQPRGKSHDESAWAENRRADLRYPAN